MTPGVISCRANEPVESSLSLIRQLGTPFEPSHLLRGQKVMQGRPDRRALKIRLSTVIRKVIEEAQDSTSVDFQGSCTCLTTPLEGALTSTSLLTRGLTQLTSAELI